MSMFNTPRFGTVTLTKYGLASLVQLGCGGLSSAERRARGVFMDLSGEGCRRVLEREVWGTVNDGTTSYVSRRIVTLTLGKWEAAGFLNPAHEVDGIGYVPAGELLREMKMWSRR